MGIFFNIITEHFLSIISMLFVIVGIITLLLSYFVDWIIPNIYKIPIQVLAIILLCSGLWYKGGEYQKEKYQIKVAKLEQELKIAEGKSNIIVTEEKYKIKEKIIYINQKKDNSIKIINENKESINDKLRIDSMIIDIYNKPILQR
jgi:hypothetical protein